MPLKTTGTAYICLTLEDVVYQNGDLICRMGRRIRKWWSTDTWGKFFLVLGTQFMSLTEISHVPVRFVTCVSFPATENYHKLWELQVEKFSSCSYKEAWSQGVGRLQTLTGSGKNIFHSPPASGGSCKPCSSWSYRYTALTSASITCCASMSVSSPPQGHQWSWAHSPLYDSLQLSLQRLHFQIKSHLWYQMLRV